MKLVVTGIMAMVTVINLDNEGIGYYHKTIYVFVTCY